MEDDKVGVRCSGAGCNNGQDTTAAQDNGAAQSSDNKVGRKLWLLLLVMFVFTSTRRFLKRTSAGPQRGAALASVSVL